MKATLGKYQRRRLWSVKLIYQENRTAAGWGMADPKMEPDD